MPRISETSPSFNTPDTKDLTLIRALSTFRVAVAKILNKDGAGSESISPDGSGNGTIAHGLSGTPDCVLVGIRGDNVNGVDVESVDATNITVRIKDASGADVTAGSFTIDWFARLA